MADEVSQKPQLPTAVNQDRLSLSTQLRCTYAALSGFATGSFLGLTHGSKTAGLRFRAENAHRLPTTQKGWYLYHKSKNYHIMLGGIADGLKLGPKLSLWASSFFAIEAIVDNVRGPGGKDFLSTIVASLTVSGAWSLWNRFPMSTAARTAKMGLYTGLAYGLLQDLTGLARGRRLTYVDFLTGRKPDTVEHTAWATHFPKHCEE